MRIDLELLRGALAEPPVLPVLGRSIDLSEAKPAAVTVPVRLEPEPRVVLVLRASELRDHGGEVGFPGGKPEPSDPDLASTALRELEEEIGVPKAAVELVGELRPVPVITGRYLIHPFVGVLGSGAAPRVAASEIARVIELPLLPLLRGEHEIAEVHATWRGIAVVSPHVDVGGPILYGASAYILYELLLRMAARLGVTLPPPRIETTPPWGDRYVREGA
jgi:8-oxo-dGTP pyrophosphatase MutT (NUDIX family)